MRQRSIRIDGFWPTQGRVHHRSPLLIRSCKRLVHVKGYLITQDIVAGPCQLVGHSLDGDDTVTAGALALIVAFDLGVEAYREVCRLDVGPGQISVFIFGVAATLALAVAQSFTAHAAAIGGIVAHLVKTPNLTRLKHNRQSENLTDAANRAQ